MLKAYLHPKKKPNDRHWYAYDVVFDGEITATDSRDPEHDLARALLARGIKGNVTAFRPPAPARCLAQARPPAPSAGSIGEVPPACDPLEAVERAPNRLCSKANRRREAKRVDDGGRAPEQRPKGH